MKNLNCNYCYNMESKNKVRPCPFCGEKNLHTRLEVKNGKTN